MKRWPRILDWVLISITAFILIFVTLLNDAKAYGPYSAEYIFNYDGDTITLAIEIWPDLVQVKRIRLAGVDAPEIKGKCEIEKVLAIDAKAYVADTLKSAKLIVVTVSKLGKYGRPISAVIADGVDLSTGLIEMGLGREYDGGKRESWCN